MVYILHNRGHLYSQAYKYKYPCDFWPHSQHWLHSHKDLHISHFDKPKLLGIQGQLSIHMVCILHMDYLYVQKDTDILTYDYLLYKML